MYFILVLLTVTRFGKLNYQFVMEKMANKKEKHHMDRVARLGCIIPSCGKPATIHHCKTYMGGGRNHLRVLPLCPSHHLFGPEAIDGKIISKRQWEQRYGSETSLLAYVDFLLNERKMNDTTLFT